MLQIIRTAPRTRLKKPNYNASKYQKKEQIIAFYNYITFSNRFHTVFLADNDSRSTREASDYNSGKLVA